MISLSEDKKSKGVYVVTKTDSEGFHHQLSLTRVELLMLYSDINRLLLR